MWICRLSAVDTDPLFSLSPSLTMVGRKYNWSHTQGVYKFTRKDGLMIAIAYAQYYNKLKHDGVFVDECNIAQLMSYVFRLEIFVGEYCLKNPVRYLKDVQKYFDTLDDKPAITYYEYRNDKMRRKFHAPDGKHRLSIVYYEDTTYYIITDVKGFFAKLCNCKRHFV